MARYGFHGEVPETKILILYALGCLTTPVTTDRLAELVMVDDGVDYFNYCQALAEMVESAHVIAADADNRTLYSISPRGYEVSELMDRQLSFSLKTAVRQGAKMLEQSVERDSFVTTEAFRRGGMPGVCCELTDGVDPVLHIELMLNDTAQGAEIARKFRKNAGKIYEKVLEVLLHTE